MRIVVLGSTGRVGSLVCREATARGIEVRAAVRSPSTTIRPELAGADPSPATDGPQPTPWPIDLNDPASLVAAMADVDAILDCLGPRANAPDHVTAFEATARRIVAAAEDRRVERLVVLSGPGVRVPGDQRGPGDRLMSGIVGLAARHVVAAKQAEHDVISASGLDWTAVRPGFVVDGPRTGRYELTEAAPRLGVRITRADIAVAIVDQVTDRTWTRRSPFLWSPR